MVLILPRLARGGAAVLFRCLAVLALCAGLAPSAFAVAYTAGPGQIVTIPPNTAATSTTGAAISATGGTISGVGIAASSTASGNGPVVLSSGASSSVSLTGAGTSISGNGTGVRAVTGGQIILGDGTAIHITGSEAGSAGILLRGVTLPAANMGSGMTIDISGAARTTNNAWLGVYADTQSHASFNNLTIGGSSVNIGVLGLGAGTTLDIANSNITINGTTPTPNTGLWPAPLNLLNFKERGLFAYQGAVINATNTAVTVNTSGPVNGILGAAQGVLNLNNVAVTMTGTGGAVSGSGPSGMALSNAVAHADGLTINTLGSSYIGAWVASGSTFTGSNVHITTSGADSTGYRMGSGASTLIDSTIQAQGSNNIGMLSTSSGTMNMTGGSLTSTATGISVLGAGSHFTFDNAVVTPGNNILLDVGANGVTTLNAINGAMLFGDAQAATANSAALNINSAAHWSGAARNIGPTTVAGGGVWEVTGNSDVSSLLNDQALIRFTPPAAGAFKTITTPNYTGANGAVLGLNTVLGGDGSPSDKLIIDGGTASGFSRLQIANAGGRGALTTGNGILLVDAINGGTTAPGAFALNNRLMAGPYDYLLFQGTADASNPEAWYLRSSYRPETSTYAVLPSLALLYGRSLIGSLHERVGEENDGRDGRDNGWARVIGAHGRQQGGSSPTSEAGPSYKYDFGALQAGHDFYRHESDDGTRYHAGGYVAAGTGNAKVSNPTGGTGENFVNAYSVGGYLTRFAASGWYLDAVGQLTWYDLEANTHRGLDPLQTNGFGYGASLETGYPFRSASGWFAEPQAQIVYQHIDLDNASDEVAKVKFKDADSLAGRLGTRLGRTVLVSDDKLPLTFWVRPSIWHEFKGDPSTSFSSATGPLPFHADLSGTWVELNAGVSARVTKSFEVFANINYDNSLDRPNETYAYEGTLGVRFTW